MNSELQLKDAKFEIKSKLIGLLTQLKGFKFVKTLYLVIKQNMTHFIHTQKAETIINESNIDDVVKWIYTKITSNIKRFSGKASVIEHSIVQW